MKNYSKKLAVLLVCIACTSCCITKSFGQCTLDLSQWHTVFADDFTTESNVCDLLNHGWVMGTPIYNRNTIGSNNTIIDNLQSDDYIYSSPYAYLDDHGLVVGKATEREVHLIQYQGKQMVALTCETYGMNSPNCTYPAQPACSYPILPCAYSNLSNNYTSYPTPQYEFGNISTTYTDFPQCAPSSCNSQWSGLKTAPGMLYGAIEIRCKLSSDLVQPLSDPILYNDNPGGLQADGGAYEYNAAWLDGSNIWPPEIDLFEHHSGDDYFFSTDHWHRNASSAQATDLSSTNYRYNWPGFNLNDDFHTWTVVWTPTEITWFFDGVQLKKDNTPCHLPDFGVNYNSYTNYQSATSNICDPNTPPPANSSPDFQTLYRWSEMFLIVGNAPQSWVKLVPKICPDETDPTGNHTMHPMIIDYVKIYKPGTDINGYLNLTDWLAMYYPMATPTDFYCDATKMNAYYTYLKNLYASTPYESTGSWVKQVLPNEPYSADVSYYNSSTNTTTIYQDPNPPVTNFFTCPQNTTGPNVLYSLKDNLRGYQGGGKYVYKGNFDLLWCSYCCNGNPYPYQFNSICVDWNHHVDGDLALSDDANLSPNNGERCFYRTGVDVFVCDIGQFSPVAQSIVVGDDHTSNIVANPNGQDIYTLGFDYPLFFIPFNCVFRTQFVGNAWVSTMISQGAFPSSAYSGSSSDIVTDPTNWEQIYWTDGKILYSAAVVNASWTTSAIASSNSGIKDLAISPTGNRILYMSNNTLYYMDKNASTWSSPQAFQAHMWGGSSLSNVGNVSDNKILVSPDPNNDQYYYVSTDNYPYVIYFNGTDFTANGMMPDMNNVGGDFNLITFGQNPSTTPHISYRGTDGLIRTIEWRSPCDNTYLGLTNTYPGLVDIGQTPSQNYYTQRQAPSNNNPINTENSSINYYLFPNPSGNITSLTCDKCNIVTDINRVTISTIEGNETEIPLRYSNGKINIDISGYSSGIYFIKVFSNSGQKTLKVVKL